MYSEVLAFRILPHNFVLCLLFISSVFVTLEFSHIIFGSWQVGHWCESPPFSSNSNIHHLIRTFSIFIFLAWGRRRIWTVIRGTVCYRHHDITCSSRLSLLSRSKSLGVVPCTVCAFSPLLTTYGGFVCIPVALERDTSISRVSADLNPVLRWTNKIVPPSSTPVRLFYIYFIFSILWLWFSDFPVVVPFRNNLNS